jgi:disulfide bond formation protein DsbB
MADVTNVSKVAGARDGGDVGSASGGSRSGGSEGGSSASGGSTTGAPRHGALASTDRLPSAALLWVVAVLSFAAVGFAVWAQHRFDWRPCPWCILQRVLFVAIGVLAVIAALWRSRGPVRALSGVAVVLALAGIGSALWQHFVAAKSASCMATLADQIIGLLGLDSALPSVFRVTGSCAEAAVSMLGVPFEFWSLGLFVVLGLVLAMTGMRRTLR